jgi:hypothetical protein
MNPLRAERIENRAAQGKYILQPTEIDLGYTEIIKLVSSNGGQN